MSTASERPGVRATFPAPTGPSPATSRKKTYRALADITSLAIRGFVSSHRRIDRIETPSAGNAPRSTNTLPIAV